MKIFQIKADANHAQWLIPNVPEDNDYLELMTFDCHPKIDQLSKCTWYVHDPKIKRTNFFIGVSGVLIFDQTVYDSDILTLFEMAGEILPITLETDEKLYILNVMECINMLDKQHTVFDYYDDGSQGRILKHSFHLKRISESCIFKIPETSRTEILTYVDIRDKDDEFFYLYKKLSFTGLKFLEM